MNAQPSLSAEDRSPLSYPIFRAIWIANLASNFGVLIQSVGASWLMVSSGGSRQMIALVQASASLPIVLISLMAGAIADNMDRRKVIIAAQTFQLAFSSVLAILAFMGLVSPWLLIALTFLVGCGTALNGPAWQTSVGDMVPRPVLPSAIALNAMSMNIARSVGPAIGGVIVASAGAAAAFALNAVSSLGLLAVLIRWRPEVPARLIPPEKILDAMFAGLRYAAMSPNIGVILFRSALHGITASAILALMPLIARDLLGGGPLVFGLLFGSFGIGAVIAALNSKRLRSRLPPEQLVRLASLLAGIAALGTAFSHSPWLTAPFIACAGFGWLLAFSTINVCVQLESPRWVVGRALSLYQMAVFAGFSGGSWAFGLFADRIGTAGALLLGVAGAAIALVAGFILPLADLNKENLDPAGRWRVPDTAIPIEYRSGPIVITIEHRIAPGDTLEFLTVMSERRRIRLRDGARRWTLMRDLADPTLWLERYSVPTWLDYVRHNQRHTHADEANSLALRKLWQGGNEPRVHRMIERQVGNIPFGGQSSPPTVE